MEPLNIVMAQLNFRVGDFAKNADKIMTVIRDHADADMLVFSELALSGYYPQDMIDEPAFLERQDSALKEILNVSQQTGAAIVLGAVTANEGRGKAHHNSLLLIQGGEVRLRYHKQLLPTYNIFDERRHFEPGEDVAAVATVKGHRIGFMICEDGWNDAGRDYAINPFRRLAEAGVNLVVSINASPSNVGKQRERHDLFAAACKRHGLPLLYVNQVGGNDELVFDGGSFLIDPEQGLVREMPLFVEKVAQVTFSGGFAGQLEAPRYLDDAEFYYRQIILGLRDYLGKTGFTSVVVGSSGGIDSALTLALAKDALGADQVKAVTMPSIFSSSGSVDDSVDLCRNLGIQLYTHGIADAYARMFEGFSTAFAAAPSRLTRENLQARLRGNILMEYSNHFGNMVLSTGNKSEMSVGYSTLYGDMNGGLNLIGDLYKTEVYALSRYYNALHGAELIPRAILEKEPSAELSEGQKDTDSLPPYPVLDEILKLRIEGRQLRAQEYERARRFVDQLCSTGQEETVSKVMNLIARSEFKRRQAPPIIRCRARAFGNGWQMPVAARY